MKSLRTLTASVFVLGLLVAAPVGAQAPDNPGQTRAEQGQQRGAEARENAQERRERVQAEAEGRRAEVLQEVCEQREERLQELIPSLATASNTLLGVMDDMYERVQEFYEGTPLTVENYDELTDEVDVAQTDASDAVEAVNDYEFELDCEEPGLGVQMDGFRQLVSEARDELHGYRGALVGFIQALRAEAAGDAADDNGDEEPDENEDDVNDEGGDDEG